MMLAAPELVIAERIELLDQIEVAAELQHRVVADRMIGGGEGAELEAFHGCSLRAYYSWLFGVLGRLAPNLWRGKGQGNRRRTLKPCRMTPCAPPMDRSKVSGCNETAAFANRNARQH